mmetsp:Transcript_306/g.858  ORF Transcript_306/g.858 Transcript_306/m.858 type:complete len:117 (-) Transcript_306:32-382(-)
MTSLPITLSDEARAVFESIFDEVDSNGDGFIEKEDIVASMKRQDALVDAEFQATHVLHAFDIDRDGRISKHEWLQTFSTFPDPSADQMAEFRRQFGLPPARAEEGEEEKATSQPSV